MLKKTTPITMFNYPTGQHIGALTGSVTKLLSHETRIAKFISENLQFDALSYSIMHDEETNTTQLRIKPPNGATTEFVTKYALGQTIEIDGSIDTFFRRYRTARTSPALRLAYLGNIKRILALDDKTSTYYIRITDIKLARLSQLKSDDALKLGVGYMSISGRKGYYLPDFDASSITFFNTAYRALMSLAYKLYPQKIVVQNPVWVVYEFEILKKDSIP